MKYEMWALTKVAKLLQQPQHRLIELRENKVVVTNGADAEGGGSIITTT